MFITCPCFCEIDAVHGIGVPKREPPPRRARVRDGPKRAYRKRKLVWPSSSSVGELKSEKPPLPQSPDHKRSCKRRVEPKAEKLEASVSYEPCNSSASAYISSSSRALPPICSAATTAASVSKRGTFAEEGTGATPRALLVSLQDADASTASARAYSSASSSGGFSFAESAYLQPPHPPSGLLMGSVRGSPHSATPVNIREPFAGTSDEALFSEQISPQSVCSTAGPLYSGISVNVSPSWEQAARQMRHVHESPSPSPISPIPPTNLALLAAAAQCNIQTVPPPAILRPNVESLSRTSRSSRPDGRRRSQQAMHAPPAVDPSPSAHGPKRVHSTVVPPTPANCYPFLAEPNALALDAQELECAASASASTFRAQVFPVGSVLLESSARSLPLQGTRAFSSPMASYSSQSSAPASTKPSVICAEAVDSDSINQIRVQFDPRARQSADRTLVSHSLKVEPSPDPRFDLLITTESRCSSVVCIFDVFIRIETKFKDCLLITTVVLFLYLVDTFPFSIPY